jgi:hypothetical protein
MVDCNLSPKRWAFQQLHYVALGERMIVLGCMASSKAYISSKDSTNERSILNSNTDLCPFFVAPQYRLHKEQP